MLSIPRGGTVATYAQIARLLNTSPPRAAGRLASANKLPVIVPCHRVIKSDGSLGGYSVSDTYVKSRLLMMEGVSISNGKVPKQYMVSSTVLVKNFRELLNHVSQGMVI
ncbi:MGMT family protein [Vulcanisaeta souniana]|uniref:methylated-DNA--[protein]-cysteine S-methyltransferase n=1 Tax=Vulcanisaeta souniana TaxID=164452 RepID=UPI000B05FFC9|nr:MGMT family protein [Vulcanisaeta souniana]